MENQLEALKNVVTRVWRNNAVYRGKMEAAGIYPDDIASLADFRKLPFTVKQDLRDSYPLGMCCASRDDVVRVHASSGTTGKPKGCILEHRNLTNFCRWHTRAGPCP